jgi:DNA-binding response OmpR family regulator
MARILLAEDDPHTRDNYQALLRQNGFDVDATATAAEARSRLEGRPYDFVLTDLRLGDGSGIEIADIATRKGLKSLIVTGFGMHLSSADLRRHHYLFKPARPSELVAAVTKMIGA